MNEFLLIATTHFIGLISPGPDIALVIKISLRHGRRAGILCALGLGSAMCIHILGVILGYGVLLSSNPWLYTLIRTVGALYLIYLGASGLYAIWKNRSKTPGVEQTTVTSSRLKHPFVTGFMTNITNPKFTLFIILLYTQIVSENTGTLLRGLYGIWMVVVAIAWFSLASIGMGSPKVRNLYVRIGKWIDLFFALILLALGITVLI